MMRPRNCIVLAAAVGTSSQALASSQAFQSARVDSGFPPCEVLKAALLGERLLFATDEAYEERAQVTFSANARLRPYCFFRPETSQEVAQGVKALAGAGSGAGDWHIAVRSGGHMFWAGSNGIVNGVTIDLSHLNATTYDKKTNLASIGPGARWSRVFADLHDHGVVVAGGRDGQVGVGGFLLGGGNSFYSGRLGFGCDSVRSFEVVLANGTIVHANRENNSALWRALKGGGLNFGIVTRFDMEAVPEHPIIYDQRFLDGSKDNARVLTDAAAEFANQDQALADNAFIAGYYHYPTGDVYKLLSITANTKGQANVSTAWDPVGKLPALSGHHATLSMSDAAANSTVPEGTRNVQATLMMRNDPEILADIDTLFREANAAMKKSAGTGWVSTMILQPVPSFFGDHSQRQGGNVMGMDKIKHNMIMWNSAWLVEDPTDDITQAKAYAHVLMLTQKVKEATKARDGDVDVVYTNYADASQDPIGSTGKDNVAFIRDVAGRYDPTGFFQKRVPGGFKVSRAQ